MKRNKKRGGEDHRTRDNRGNSKARRARREWLLSQHGQAQKDGTVLVKCHHCPTMLEPAAMQVDRFPVCGHSGGKYDRDNIVPCCAPCNRNRCNSCERAKPRSRK